MYETDGSGTVLRQYVYATSGARLAMKSKGQTLYYHYNPRGDVIAMTDQNKEVVATYEYDSWGNVLKSDTKVSQQIIRLGMRDTCMIKK